jgi:hypothetical protein
MKLMYNHKLLCPQVWHYTLFPRSFLHPHILGSLEKCRRTSIYKLVLKVSQYDSNLVLQSASSPSLLVHMVMLFDPLFCTFTPYAFVALILLSSLVKASFHTLPMLWRINFVLCLPKSSNIILGCL